MRYINNFLMATPECKDIKLKWTKEMRKTMRDYESPCCRSLLAFAQSFYEFEVCNKFDGLMEQISLHMVCSSGEPCYIFYVIDSCVCFIKFYPGQAKIQKGYRDLDIDDIDFIANVGQLDLESESNADEYYSDLDIYQKKIAKSYLKGCTKGWIMCNV